ncbi:MAG: M20/M25/M40 family metallo-hydrolase, partial [Clostridia bacterium]|nr:M20/M25/M40 family metallo-hydrolase [Clostridia bacterium]
MESVNILSKLVGYKTDNDEKGINGCLKYVQKTLNKYGWKTTLVKNEENNKQNLFAVLNGELGNINDGLLLAGHIDTVTTSVDKWATNPLKLTKDGDNLYGLGVADMKAFTGAILSSLDKINQLEIKKPIVIALTNDEETVMYSVNKVVSFMKENKILPQFAIIGEPSNMIFSTSNKGFYEFETVIHGKACHSSAPQLGINAIYIMSKLISFIESLSKKYNKKGTTINVGTINGGT